MPFLRETVVPTVLCQRKGRTRLAHASPTLIREDLSKDEIRSLERLRQGGVVFEKDRERFKDMGLIESSSAAWCLLPPGGINSTFARGRPASRFLRCAIAAALKI
jgi:hypothetical protein